MHRKIDRFDSSSNQPQSFGDFPHGHTGRETKLTCPSPTTTTGARGPRFHDVGDEESPYDMRETLHLLATRQTGKSTSCASFPSSTSTPCRNRKERQAYSLFLQTTMEAPVTWTLVLFQQAIDRQDRTTD